MRYLLLVLVYLLIVLGTFFLGGCSTITLCCPNHGGMITSTTVDLLGTTSLTCGTNTASVGGPTALLNALLPLLAAAGKTPIGATATPQTYQCQ